MELDGAVTAVRINSHVPTRALTGKILLPSLGQKNMGAVTIWLIIDN